MTLQAARPVQSVVLLQSADSGHLASHGYGGYSGESGFRA